MTQLFTTTTVRTSNPTKLHEFESGGGSEVKNRVQLWSIRGTRREKMWLKVK
jgi:hypothetical protein